MSARALRRHASTIVLGVLVAAASVVVFVVDRGAVTTDEAEQRKGNLFDAWRADDVTEVALTRGGRTTRLVRGAGDDGQPGFFRVEIDGASYAGDEQAIDDYLGRLEFALAERRVTAGSIDRAAFGLTAPRLTVEVTMGALRRTLAIGGEAPKPPGSSYAEVAGRGVFVVTSQLVAALDVAPETFRSRTFVPYVTPELASIELATHDGSVKLTRAPWSSGRGPGFRVDPSSPDSPDLGPIAGARVSAASMELVAAALGAMQASSFLDDAAADRAARDDLTLRLAPRDPAAAPGEIAIGGDCPDRESAVVAIRRSPTRAAVCLPREAVEPLRAPLRDLVDRKLVGATLDEVTEVRFEEGATALEIARSGYGFRERSPHERDVDPDAGRAFLEALLRVEATRFAAGDAAALGLSPPRLRVRVTSIGASAIDAGSDRVETIEVGSATREGVYARRLEDGAILALPPDAARRLGADDRAFRERALLTARPGDVSRLRVEQAGVTQVIERAADGSLSLAEPKGEGLTLDPGLALQALEVLTRLRAERWVTDDDPGAFGLASPRITIEAEIAGDPGGGAPRRFGVRLGALAPSGGAYARVDGDPDVLVAPRAFEETITTLLLDRSALAVRASDVTRVTLEAAAGAKRVFERVGKDGERPLARVGAGSVDAVAAAADVEESLGDLTATAAVSLGAPRPIEGFERPRLRAELSLADGATVRLVVGARATLRDIEVDYVRRDGVAATYAVARAKIDPLLDAVR
jgi:hypothetical protein